MLLIRLLSQSVQSLSCVWLFATPWTAARQASLSTPTVPHCCCSVTKSCPIPWNPWTAAHCAPLSSAVSQSLLKFMSTESVMLSNHLILCHTLLRLSSVFPMNIQGWFSLRWTDFISLQSKDSQESSPTPQFRSINSLALNLLYGPTLTYIHDYWKK